MYEYCEYISEMIIVFLRVNGKEFDKKHLDEIDPSKVKSISVKKDGKGGGTIDIYLKNE